MPDIGFMELLVVGIVALIVVGPKDLPGLFRTVGKFVGKARGMAREFQRSMEEAADASGLNEATKSFKDINNLRNYSPDKVIKKKFGDIMEAKESGVPMKDDTGEADDDIAAAVSDLMDEPMVPTAKPKAAAKPKTAAKAKAAVKPKAKAKAKAKPKAKTTKKPVEKAQE